MESNYLKIAKQAAYEAGEIIARHFGGEHQYKFKNEDESDFATQADLEAEQKIIETLTKNFPEHNIISEEKGEIPKGSEYTWVIDPLDGTFSFSIGMPFSAVSIGLLKSGEPILGVVYHVAQKDLYWAEKGKGAYLNDQPIHVSKQEDLSKVGMTLDFGHKNSRPAKIDLYILPLCKEVGQIYAIGTTSLCMALTARGIVDGMAAQAWIWDFAAGAVIVKEAGGKVTDLQGEELDWSKKRLNTLATNGLIHDAILKVLKIS